jgi:ParB family chromosome partitioning protein
MSLKERMAAKTAAIAGLSNTPRESSMNAAPKTGPGQFLAAMPLLAEKDAELEAMSAENEQLRSELKVVKAKGAALDVPVDKIHEVAGRRRYMPPEKFAELRENLRHNKMINPVILLPREDGEWDMWSGHHRWDAHIELGRPTIKAVQGEVESDVEATDGAFFANLMQSDLTDFEKYVGLKRFHEGHPDLSQTQIAEFTGLSKQDVSYLFSFDRLPPGALSVIQEHKSIIGAKAVSELAVLAEQGKAERVVEAVKLLAEKKLDQSQTVKYARATQVAPVAKPAADAFKVKAGKATFCDVRLVKNVMRIEFKSEAQAAAVREAIRAQLEALAQADAGSEDAKT